MPAKLDVFEAGRIFRRVVEDCPGVNPGTPAVASLCEVDDRDRPFMGDAGMKVYSVVPLEGRIEVRGEVDWTYMLRLRLTVIWE